MILDHYDDAGKLVASFDGNHIELPDGTALSGRPGDMTPNRRRKHRLYVREERPAPPHNPLTHEARLSHYAVVKGKSRAQWAVTPRPPAERDAAIAARRAELRVQIQREARRRVDAVAPAWVQRDWIATAVIDKKPSVLRTQWAPIIAIRDRAATLETSIDTMPVKDLPTFDPRDDAHW